MPTNTERIIILESNFSFMKNKINEIDNTVSKIDEKMDMLIHKLDARYAKKASVDKLRAIVWSVIAFGFIALGGAILKIIIK